MLKRNSRFILALAALAVAWVASPAVVSSTEEIARKSIASIEGTTLRIAARENESPNVSAEWAYDVHRAYILGNVYERLLDRHPETNELIGVLATSWEPTDDVTWRFTLREGVTFHDGSDWNAEAAAVSLAHILRDESVLHGISGRKSPPELVVVDNFVIDVVLPAPDPLLPAKMASASIPSAKQILEDPDSYTTTPIGTGPYKITDYNPTTHYNLERNEAWWGIDNPDAIGAQHWEKVVFGIRPEATARAAALAAGEVDMAIDVGEEGCKVLGDLCRVTSSPTFIEMRYDVPSTILGDVRVREALELGYDRYAIAEHLFGGAQLTSQPVRPGAAGYREDLPPYPYDPERAKQLIEEAKADGVVFDAPIRLVTLTERMPRNVEFVESIGSYWETNLGIDVDVQILERALWDQVYNTNIDTTPPGRHMIAVLTGGDFGFFDLEGYVPLRHPCGSIEGNACDPAFDEMYNAARQLVGTEREEAMAEVAYDMYHKIWWTQTLYLPAYHAVADHIDFIPRGDSYVRVVELKPRS